MTETDTRPAEVCRADYTDLLPGVERIATEAGERLRGRYSDTNRITDRQSLILAARANEDASAPALKQSLQELRPHTIWLEDDLETVPLPAGEFWVVDTVEGNVNHIHGLPDWCVSITLVVDGQPQLTVVRQPALERTYTAIAGHGALLNGRPLHVSNKPSLATAIVVTGQAEADQSDTYRRIGQSITAMLHAALLVRASVPSTFPLLLVASGQNDVFWQYNPTLPGIAAGILLATEAGAVISRIDGSTWAPGAQDILVSTPALAKPSIDVLATIA